MEAETESYETRGGAIQYKHQQNVLATVVYFRYQYEGQFIGVHGNQSFSSGRLDLLSDPLFNKHVMNIWCTFATDTIYSLGVVGFTGLDST